MVTSVKWDAPDIPLTRSSRVLVELKEVILSQAFAARSPGYDSIITIEVGR